MKIMLPLILLGCLMQTACGPLETKARDTIGAMKGLLDSEQALHQSECSINSKTILCDAIQRGAAAQNALVTVTEDFCGFNHAAPPAADAVCVPNKALAPSLQTAIGNVNLLIAEIKAASGGR